jgi:hypothetical protein
MAFETLVGRKIITVSKNQEANRLCFETDAGSFVFYADGDCCSESWFNHLEGLDALIGGTVRAVEEIDMGDLLEADAGHSGRQSLDSLYGFKIQTDKGTAQIEMRNASNGYYGGSVVEDERLDAGDGLAVQVREDF